MQLYSVSTLPISPHSTNELTFGTLGLYFIFNAGLPERDIKAK